MLPLLSLHSPEQAQSSQIIVKTSEASTPRVGTTAPTASRGPGCSEPEPLVPSQLDIREPEEPVVSTSVSFTG
jgi:hypothetical protein